MSAKDHKYSIEELLCALLRDQGIHEGHWALNIEFSATGASGASRSSDSRYLTQPRRNFGQGGTAISGATPSGSRPQSCG